jgi:ribosome-associated heat shock protein Hsp15
MRLDLLLVRLRFTKSRGRAQELIARGHIRRNGKRVTEPDERIAPGDVLTLPLGQLVRLVRVLALPERRGPASEAQGCYSYIDARPSNGLAEPGNAAAIRSGEGP